MIVISWVRDRKWLIYPKPVNQLLSTAEQEAANYRHLGTRPKMINLAKSGLLIVVVSLVRDRKWFIQPKPVNKFVLSAGFKTEND